MKSKCCRANTYLKMIPTITDEFAHVCYCKHCKQPCEVIKEEPRYLVEQTREKNDICR